MKEDGSYTHNCAHGSAKVEAPAPIENSVYDIVDNLHPRTDPSARLSWELAGSSSKPVVSTKVPVTKGSNEAKWDEIVRKFAPEDESTTSEPDLTTEEPAEDLSGETDGIPNKDLKELAKIPGVNDSE